MKLTLPQQDVYYEQLMYPNVPIYNIGAKIAINGPIEYKTLNKAYKALINQHDSYRSYITVTDDVPIMLTDETFTGELKYIDFSLAENPEAAANKYMNDTFRIPFILNESKQLHRFALIKMNDTFHYLFSVYHHIITDGWGTSLMFQRLVKNYNELLENGKIISAYPFTYADFVTDDIAYTNSEAYTKDKAYWKEKFQQMPAQLFETITGKGSLPESGRKAIKLKRDIYNQLEKIGKDAGCSTFHVILGILFLYFGRKHQNNDFAIGLPVLKRGKAIFKKTVGLFMGITPLRIQLNQESNFTELMKVIKSQFRLDYRHQRFPLGKMIKELSLFEEKNRLFNITLSYEKQNYADHFLNTDTKVIPLSHHAERVALAIYIREFDPAEDVTLDFDYNFSYFKERDIDKITTHIQNLVSAIIESPSRALSSYEYIDLKEKNILLNQFNETNQSYPTDISLIDVIAQQADLYPNKIILADETKSYTYAQVESLSNHIANYIFTNLAPEKGTPIAVFMERSADLVITLLGVMKSGHPYIPLDPSFPKNRLSYILKHSGVQQIIGNKSLKKDAPQDTNYVALEMIFKTSLKKALAINKSRPESTAYIIYTSGSTGNPKGVAVSHKALLNFLMSMQNRPGIAPIDTLFSVTTPSFDISILEFFGPLISGAKLYMANQQLLADPLAIVEKITTINPSIIQATPSFYQMLYNAGWTGNENIKVWCGGDLLSEALAEKLLVKNCELWNMYGPTETTIWSSCKKIQNASEAATIGQPIHNTQIYILDNQLQLLPINCVGKIYIGGDGLAQGYYKELQLTNERFIENPFSPGQKMYDTGDLGKWNTAGEIVFYGRNDYQVKIRGYRIELTEIESKLNQLDEVKEAVVVAHKQDLKETTLIAYVIPEIEINDTSKLTRALQKQLPEYMIPYNIITLEEFPLTANKKVDRKTLTQRTITLSEREIVNPTTDLEKSLLIFFKEVLESNENISITDNFFRLGGHSLNAVKLINLIDEQLHYRITLKEVFENPSIQKLSDCLDKKEQEAMVPTFVLEEKEFYDITPSQYHIWLASHQEEKSIAYNMIGIYKIHGKIHKEILEQVLFEVVKKHEILRTSFLSVNGIAKQKIVPVSEINNSIDELFVEKDEISKTLQSFANTPFNLEQAYLLKIALAHSKGDASFLMFKTHHIIMDGWSIEILIEEILKNYQAKIKGQDLVGEADIFQFKNYTYWHQKEMQKSIDKNTAFWSSYLEQYSWKSIITKDANNEAQLNTGSTIRKSFSAIDINSIHQFIKEEQISLHNLLVGTFNMVAHKMYGHNDICIGTMNTGRSTAAVRKNIGMFAKTLPLRTPLNAKHKLLNILHDIQDNILTINAYEDIPTAVLNTLRIDTLLVLQNTSSYNDQIQISNDVFLSHYPFSVSYSRIPLLLHFIIDVNELKINVDYNNANYEAATIEVLLLKFEKMLQLIIENPNQTLEEIDLALEIEKQETITIDFAF